MSKTLRPLPLNAEAFAPYGEVLSDKTARETRLINDGYTTRFHDMAAVDTLAEGGRPGLSLFRSTPLARPIQIRRMECHPVASQAFMPLSPRPYLVVVAPDAPGTSKTPDWEQLEVFLAVGQGVSYRAGTWHHFSLALEAVSDFLVIDRLKDGEADSVNLIEIDAPEPIVIDY